MKTCTLCLTSTLALLGSAAAHPGHHHESMPAPELAAHHILTNGTLAVAALGALLLIRRVIRQRRAVAPAPVPSK